MRRRLLGVAVVLVLLAVAHLGWWYLPRPRPSSPQPATEAARLFADVDFELALWVPYPHQNLPALARLTGLDGEGLEALERLAGLPKLELPGFGPLALPPASALTLAAGGERQAASAEVYPAAAAFTRLAGRLARNSWLAGGHVEHQGRAVEVAWRGGAWNAASPTLPPATAAATPRLAAPALAMLELRRARPPLPTGRYRLERRGEALEVTAGEVAPAEPALDLDLVDVGAFLMIFSGRGGTGAPQGALVVFRPEGGGPADLPRAAALYRSGDDRHRLPGERLLRLGGRRPHQDRAAGWELAALDASSLAQAGRLAPLLDGAGTEGLAWGLWLDLEAGRHEVARIAGLLAALPLIPPRELERWRDAELLLELLAERYSRLTILVGGRSNAFHLRLE